MSARISRRVSQRPSDEPSCCSDDAAEKNRSHFCEGLVRQWSPVLFLVCLDCWLTVALVLARKGLGANEQTAHVRGRWMNSMRERSTESGNLNAAHQGGEHSLWSEMKWEDTQAGKGGLATR